MTLSVETGAIALPWELGFVTPLTAADVVTLIHTRTDATAPLILGNLNLHALYQYQVDEKFRDFCHNADLVLVDGWPILKLAERATKTSLSSDLRVGSTDWLTRLVDNKPEITVVALGGTPSSSKGAADYVAARAPGITWHAFDGYEMAKQSGDPSVLLHDALAAADLVLVGLGMPRQEGWIQANKHLVHHAVIANVGGCLDYLSGEQALAPRWLGSVGLEWLYRLAKSPRRLAGRYLVEPVKLLAVVVRKQSRRR